MTTRDSSAALLGYLLPLAAAIAASPFAIGPALLVLLGERPRAKASRFVLGWLVGVAVVTTLAALLAELVESSDEPAAWTSWVRVLLGVVLVALAVRQWTRRADATGEAGWLQSVTQASPAEAARLGLLLSALNPKVAVIAGAAGVTIGRAVPQPPMAVAWSVGFAALASVTVAAPLLAHLVAGDRVLAPVRRAADWLARHEAAVVAAVLAVIGVVLLVTGVTELA
jgi:threonine/homoserine/homoserine lactone efflux protein